MTKKILKEIVIVLLLLIVVLVLFGIIFYDYIPTSKTPPAKVQAYEMPEDIKEEIDEALVSESQNVIKTYTIDSSDLSVYESNESYDKGKPDPFSSYKANTSSNTDNTNTNTNINTDNKNDTNSNTGNTTENKNSNSTEKYFNEVK